MKQTFILLLAGVFLFSCAEKKEAASTPAKDPNQNGYTVAKSANIDLVKAFNEKAFALDTAAVRAAFAAENDTIHDNLTKLNVTQNNELLGNLKGAGLKFTIKNYGALWETINDEPTPAGVKNFVIAYMLVNASNGKKSKDVLFHQVCAVKDGKIVEEWDVYDTKIFDELLK